MAFKFVCSMLAVAWMAVAMVNGGGTKQMDGGRSGEVNEIVFPSNEGNGTDEIDNSTLLVSQSPDIERVPIRFGQWMVFGCHNNDESWGCEMRRLMQVSAIGFIDTLKFTVRKDKSLKMANVKEKCEKCVSDKGGSVKNQFRIVVKCPKQEECSEKVLRRLKVAYFQAGFLFAVAIALVWFMCCACLCKAFKTAGRANAPPPDSPPRATLVYEKPLLSKW